MINTHVKYLSLLFIKTVFKISGIIFTLILIINIFEEINFLQSENVNFFFPLFLSLLNTPSIVFDLCPFIFLISTQFFFIKLVEKNELQIFKYMGYTNIRILKIISVISLLLGVFIIFVFYNFSSKLKNSYLDIKNNFSKDNKYLAVITDNGLWIKDEINGESSIINAEKISGPNLLNVTISQFNSDFEIVQNIKSKKVNVTEKKWVLEEAIISKSNNNYEEEQLIFDSNFDLKKINSLFSNLYSLTMWELSKLKKDYFSLNYSVTDIKSHELKLYSFPIYLTLMTLLSSIVMFNSKYQKSLIINIVLGIFLSVMIYYINFFINILGLNGSIPIILSIFLPQLILLLISLIGLVRINEK
jgi:lipopolysaccharide export system permease protein